MEYVERALAVTVLNSHSEYVVKNMKTAYRRAGRSDVDLPWWYDNVISPKVGYDSIVMIDGVSGTVMNDKIRQELSGSEDGISEEIGDLDVIIYY